MIVSRMEMTTHGMIEKKQKTMNFGEEKSEGSWKSHHDDGISHNMINDDFAGNMCNTYLVVRGVALGVDVLSGHDMFGEKVSLGTGEVDKRTKKITNGKSTLIRKGWFREWMFNCRSQGKVKR